MMPPADVGPYQVLGELGRGSTGVVYRGRHRELDRVAAVKVIRVADLADPADAERFLRGARAAARLDHPGLVRIYEAGRDGDLLYVAMSLVEGPTLGQRLAVSGPMRPDEAVALVRRVASALHAAHQHKVLHRNLDPASVLLAGPGDVRLTGIGQARPSTHGHTITTAATGDTASGFEAPERVTGVTTGPQTDVYGLGAILYAALTGHAPVVAPNAAELGDSVVRGAITPPGRLAKVPPRLEAVCLRCLATRPENRYPSAVAVLEALDEIEDGLTAGGTRPGFFRGRSLHYALAALGVAFLVGAGVWVVNHRPGDAGSPTPGPSQATVPQGPVASEPDLAAAHLAAEVAIPRASPDGKGLTFDWEAGAEAFAAAFRAAGIEASAGVAALAARLDGLPSPRKERVIEGLERWEVCADGAGRHALAAELRALQAAIDRDEWRQRFRTIRSNPGGAGVTAFATEAAGAAAPPGRHELLSLVLLARDRACRPDSIAYLRLVKSKDGGGFWPNLALGSALLDEARGRQGEVRADLAEEGFWAWQAAFSSRPQATPLAELLNAMVGRERDVAGWVLKTGGRVQVRAGENALPAVLSGTDRLPEGCFLVTAVSLSTIPITGKDLDRLADLTAVSELHLNGTGVGDDDVRRVVRAVPTLGVLNLEDTAVTGAVLSNPAELRRVYLLNTRVTVGDLAARPPQLRQAFVLDTPAPPLQKAARPFLVFEGQSSVVCPLGHPYSGPFTAEAWAFLTPRPGGALQQTVLSMTTATGMTAEVRVYLTERRARFDSAGPEKNWRATDLPPADGVRLGRWFHLAACSDGKSVRLYIDGRAAGAVELARGSPDATFDRLTLGTGFTGSLREVRVSSTVRYEGEFVPAPRHQPDGQTLALYRLDEGDGDTARDSSSRGNTGKITNPRREPGS